MSYTDDSRNTVSIENSLSSACKGKIFDKLLIHYMLKTWLQNLARLANKVGL
jgi:hypothetical protein